MIKRPPSNDIVGRDNRLTLRREMAGTMSKVVQSSNAERTQNLDLLLVKTLDGLI